MTAALLATIVPGTVLSAASAATPGTAARTTSPTNSTVTGTQALVPTSPLSEHAIRDVVSRSGNRNALAGGDDAPVTQAQQRRENQERQLAMAATWHLDPALLKDQPTDSAQTRTVRAKLRRLNTHLTTVMKSYNDALSRAQAAKAAADQAAANLASARAAQAAATARYTQQHDRLVALLTQAYETGSNLSTLQILVDSENRDDLLFGMDVMRELSASQADIVRDAATAAQDMTTTAAAVDAAAQSAQDQLTAADALLAKAATARNSVLGDLNRARLLLQNQVLADQMAASMVSGQAAAQAAAEYTANGAKVSFPLPPGATYVDQHNYGARSNHWATIHTGDDFSTACGTPVLAATAGTIVIRTDQSWAGPWLVMVSTGEGKLTTWYAHMEALAVTDGQKVKAGQAIGLVGEEGNATGCHLHFEVHPAGGSIYQDNTDPGAWLTAVGVYKGGGSPQ